MSDLKSLENQLNEARHLVQLKAKFERLLVNPDFQELIMRGYCYEECARAVKMSIDLNVSKEQREDALRVAQASGYLEKYIQTLVSFGNTAERDIPALIEQIENARVEEA